MNKRFAQARPFYAAIIVATVLGAAALFWRAGPLAPPLLAVIMLVGANRRIMGHRVNGRWITLLGWCTVALMSAAGVGLFLT